MFHYQTIIIKLFSKNIYFSQISNNVIINLSYTYLLLTIACIFDITSKSTCFTTKSIPCEILNNTFPNCQKNLQTSCKHPHINMSKPSTFEFNSNYARKQDPLNRIFQAQPTLWPVRHRKINSELPLPLRCIIWKYSPNLPMSSG